MNSAIPDLGIGSTLSSIGSDVSSGLSSGVNELSNAVGAGDIVSGTTAAPIGNIASADTLGPGGETYGPDQFVNTNIAPPGSQDAPAGFIQSASTNPNTNAFVQQAGTGAAAPSAVDPNAPMSIQGVAGEGINAPNAAGGTNIAGSATLNNPAAAAGGTASAAATPSTGSEFLSHPGMGTFKDMLMANPGAAISAGGLGLAAIRGNQPVKGEKQLQEEAAQMGAQGQQLQSYLQNGTLPPGVEQSINQAAEARKAAIRSQYANSGSSGSSAEQQDLAAVDAWSQGQGASTAIQLLQQGIGESGMAARLYQSIANNALQQDQQLSQAVGNFASTLAGGTGGNSKDIVLKVGQNGQVGSGAL
jgi:hypothetical protein